MIEFSVVIAVYNKQEYLAKTLESVLNQTYSNFELIIVNDGSTDASHDIIQNYLSDDRIAYIQQENQGAGAARNAGIKRASKPYIALLDADDVWDSNHLEVTCNLINQFPNEHIYATNSVIKERNQIVKRSYSISDSQQNLVLDFFEASLQHSIINSSTATIHKNVFEQLGLYNPHIKSGQDTELFIRIGMKYKIVFTPLKTVNVIRSYTSLSRSTVKLSQKMPLDIIKDYENLHPPAKKFMDLNRYSYCLLAKLSGNNKAQKSLIQQINFNNLNNTQKLLLKLPSWVYIVLLKFKRVLITFGIQLSAYK